MFHNNYRLTLIVDCPSETPMERQVQNWLFGQHDLQARRRRQEDRNGETRFQGQGKAKSRIQRQRKTRSWWRRREGKI